MRQVPGLAGPNDMVQILIQAAPWLTIYALGKPFLDSMLKEAGKDAWDKIKSLCKKPIPTDLKEDDVGWLRVVFDTLKQARKDGNYVVLGFPVEETSFRGRSIGIELDEVTPESLVRTSAILANIGQEIETALQQYDRKFAHSENRDCSCAITINADGTTECSFNVGAENGELVVLRFDASGKRM
ncbi:hypothetical protein [Mesorhizobium sp. LjNodule214]|uniref:hypothetical protein n=1 Tax=Mesorhizobium sp. LjNodule214 TaxID=3342252 RepID=UPI003ECD4707